jgi:hypothetical protein
VKRAVRCCCRNTSFHSYSPTHTLIHFRSRCWVVANAALRCSATNAAANASPFALTGRLAALRARRAPHTAHTSRCQLASAFHSRRRVMAGSRQTHSIRCIRSRRQRLRELGGSVRLRELAHHARIATPRTTRRARTSRRWRSIVTQLRRAPPLCPQSARSPSPHPSHRWRRRHRCCSRRVAGEDSTLGRTWRWVTVEISLIRSQCCCSSLGVFCASSRRRVRVC